MKNLNSKFQTPQNSTFVRTIEKKIKNSLNDSKEIWRLGGGVEIFAPLGYNVNEKWKLHTKIRKHDFFQKCHFSPWFSARRTCNWSLKEMHVIGSEIICDTDSNGDDGQQTTDKDPHIPLARWRESSRAKNAIAIYSNGILCNKSRQIGSADNRMLQNASECFRMNQ